MRSTNFLFALILFLCCVGCKDDAAPEPEIAVPTISLEAPGLTIADDEIVISIRKDSTLEFSYAILAEAGIQEFTRTVNGEEVTIEVTGEEELSGAFVVDLPYQNASFEVKLHVKDSRDEIADVSVNVVVMAAGPRHGDLRALMVSGAGTKVDYNDANYTFAGHRHMHHRSTDFESATTPTPTQNTKAGWQAHLDGIYPILTSDDFNNQATLSGTTLELTNGPTPSGKWLKRQTSAAIKEMFPANSRLRNWNLFSNNSGFKPGVYVSFYVQTFKGDDTGKLFRMYWRRDLPSADKKYSTSYWVGKPEGSNGFTWRLEWADNGELAGWADQTYEIDGKWNRVELIFDFVNDKHALLVNGEFQTDVSRPYNGIIDGQMGLNSVVTYALLGNTVDPVLEHGHHLGWAQPYADFSLKRIELADSPDWETKSKSVIQPVKSWESDNIEFIINQGDFADLNNKHIFYVDGFDATYVGPLE